MIYEHKLEPLLPYRRFVRRLLSHVLAALIVILASLGLGVAGYHFLEHLGWLDALLNAAMILGGMGPVNALQTSAGKVFASFYALFSGVIFLVVVGVIMVPVVHRLLHRFHIERGRGQD